MAVRKATEEAMQSSSSQGALEPKFKSVSTSATGDSTADGENADPNVVTKQNNNESFALGMTLFGKEMHVIERSIQEKLTKMERELQSVVQVLHTNSEEQSNDEEASSPAVLEADAKELQKRIEFLQICSKARATLDEATTISTASTTNDPDYVGAAKLLVQSKAHLKQAEAIVKAEEDAASSPTNALFGAYRIIDSIRTAIRRKNLDLLSKATHLLETSVTMTANSISVKGASSSSKNSTTTGSTSSSPQGLHAAYDVIETLSPSNHSSLHKSLVRLTDQLVNFVVQPVLQQLQEGSATPPWSFSDSSSRHMTSLEWEQDDLTATTVPNGADMSVMLPAWKEAFSFLERTLAFFQQHVLLDRDALCAHIGNRLFATTTTASDGLTATMRALGVESNRLGVYSASIMQPLLDLLWETCIPTTSGEQQQLQEIAISIQSCTDSFDAEMKRLKFYDASPLGVFVSNLSQKYVDKRRTTILNQARTILLHNDYHNTVEVGDTTLKQPSVVADGTTEEDAMAVFQLHKCAVSQTATLIMGLCRETMEEATSPISNEDETLALLPATLYRTAREMLDLFRAVIPTTLEKEIANVPRIAAVLHNDCVYFAHHCLTLGLEYKERFPPVKGPQDVRGQALRQTCMFVDMVPIFRELADQAMGDMLEKQHRQLCEIVGSRIALFGESLKSNESLSEWVDAETAMKAGAYHVKHLSQAWRPVLSAQVQRRSIGFLMDTIFNLYLDQVFRASSAISEPACHFVSSVFRLGMQAAVDVTANDISGCQSWDRFSAVGRFVDMSLADINVALSDGVFRSITGPELSGLIMATFDDSDKRRKLLHALASES
jgi:centromere/kinetochore protein ZW10